MVESKPILTIAIPTYNRCQFLDKSLGLIESQIMEYGNCIELLVSDNCSTDATFEVVRRRMESGLRLKYIRNSENIGMDGNFVQCFKSATASYIWVLGDDDFLRAGAIGDVIEVLRNAEVGLLHLSAKAGVKSRWTEYTDPRAFLKEVSYWITFISANIVNSQYVGQIEFEKYMGSYFTIIPLYMLAAGAQSMNCIMYHSVLDRALDGQNNGGYNYYEIFAHNYPKIWLQAGALAGLTKLDLEVEKARLFVRHILPFTYRLLFCGKLGRFDVSNAWGYLLSAYWYHLYVYPLLLAMWIKSVARNFMRWLRFGKTKRLAKR